MHELGVPHVVGEGDLLLPLQDLCTSRSLLVHLHYRLFWQLVTHVSLNFVWPKILKMHESRKSVLYQ